MSYLKNVAIVGATGRVGKAFATALLATGKHNVTALIRTDTNKANLPAGIKTVEVDYSNPDSLVSAFRGHDFAAITLAAMAPPELHSQLVQAAVKAGVKWIMPNIYGNDPTNEKLGKEALFDKSQDIKELQELGVNHVIMACGFWYEWSLAMPVAFGFDIAERKVTFYDDGKTMIDISTWDQCGRALAALLSLPESGATPCVEDWKNKPLFINSFKVSQRDMLDSLHRVLGTKDTDWEIEYEPSSERYQKGLEQLKAGDRMGFGKAMYSRILYPNGGGDFSSKYALANRSLGLPKDDLDAATKRAADFAMSGGAVWDMKSS